MVQLVTISVANCFECRRAGKPGRSKTTPDDNANVAASYGVDTVHTWTIVSGRELRRQQLSGWQSDVALYDGGAHTVSVDLSPFHQISLKPQPQQQQQQQHQTEFSTAPAPVAPPRTRRKARAPLPAVVVNNGTRRADMPIVHE